MASIQFRGLNETLTAFENRDAQAWSLWDGKAFMFRGVGSGALQTILESLSKNGSTAIYTLKVYEDISDEKQIKQKTECDGSFNFRLFEREDERLYAPGRGLITVEEKLNQRIDQFEERMLALLESRQKEEEEEVEEEGDLMGAITGLLQDPDKLGKLINIGKSIFGQSMQPAYVGTVNRIMEGNGGSSPSPSLSPSINPNSRTAPIDENSPEYEAAVTRLGQALNTLELQDPKIVEHLEKLAAMSVNKPDQFKVLIGMLEAL